MNYPRIRGISDENYFLFDCNSFCMRFNNGVTVYVNTVMGFNSSELAQISLVDTRCKTIDGKIKPLEIPMDLNVLPMFCDPSSSVIKLPSDVKVYGYIGTDEVARFLYEASQYTFE